MGWCNGLWGGEFRPTRRLLHLKSPSIGDASARAASQACCILLTHFMVFGRRGSSAKWPTGIFGQAKRHPLTSPLKGGALRAGVSPACPAPAAPAGLPHYMSPLRPSGGYTFRAPNTVVQNQVAESGSSSSPSSSAATTSSFRVPSLPSVSAGQFQIPLSRAPGSLRCDHSCASLPPSISAGTFLVSCLMYFITAAKCRYRVIPGFSLAYTRIFVVRFLSFCEASVPGNLRCLSVARQTG